MIPTSEDENNDGVGGLDLDVDPALTALLEKYDGLQDIVIAPMVSTESSVRAMKDMGKQQPDPTKKSWHQRRRKEIIRLREEVANLSATLSSEKAKLRVILPATQASGGTRRGEAVASREWMRLQKSTEENTKLRGLVRHRHVQNKAVERSFKARMRTTTPLPVEGVRSPSLFNLAPVRTARSWEVFKDLLTGMDEVYADLDSVFDRVKMHELPCPGRSNDSSKSQDPNVFMEILDSYKVPFDLRQTENATWELKTTSAGEASTIFAEFFAVDDKTRLKSVCVAVTRHGIDIRVVAHVAVRKYVEQGRVVFISRALIEPIQDVFVVAFKETARLVLQPGPPCATGPTTVIQTLCRATQNENLASQSSSWRTTPYYESSLRGWERSISLFNHKLEDTLLRESLHVRTA